MPDVSRKPRTPAGLGARGKRFWRRVTGRFALDDAEIEVLALACRALDRVQALEDELAGAPATVPGSAGQPRPNPLAGELRAEVTLAAKLLGQLGVPGEDEKGSDWDGLSASQRARRAARSRWDHRGAS